MLLLLATVLAMGRETVATSLARSMSGQRCKMETRTTSEICHLVSLPTRSSSSPALSISSPSPSPSSVFFFIAPSCPPPHPDAILSTPQQHPFRCPQPHSLPLASRQCQQSPSPLAASLTSVILSNHQPHSSQALQTVPTPCAAQHHIPRRHLRKCPPPGPRRDPSPRDNLHPGYCREEDRLKPAPNTPSKRCPEPVLPEKHQYMKTAGEVHPQIAPQRKCEWKCCRTGADNQD